VIKVRFLRSFDESLAYLPERERVKARKAVHRLLDYFQGGPKPIGMGLRKLRSPYWEVRASLACRVVFALERELATFILVGSHDEVRRVLARHA